MLDFVNDREEILESFQTFYEGTTVLETVDPQRLYELSGQLDAAQVYFKQEVDRFARVFFKPKQKQRASDNADHERRPRPRRGPLQGHGRGDLARSSAGQLQAFVNLYGFMAQVVPFSDADLEKLYVFGKMLLRKLPRPEVGPRPPRWTSGKMSP